MSEYISKERAHICVMAAIEGSESEEVLRALDDVRAAIDSEPAANVVTIDSKNAENERKRISIIEAVEQLYDYCETRYQCNGCIFQDGNGCMLSKPPYVWKIDEIKKSEESMSEYISRDYAMKEMHAIVKRYQSPVETGLALCAMITGAPIADVAPVVHGHWSKEMRFTEDFMGNRTYGYKCSVCGKLANRLQFCGNCGAKMDGGEETEC